LHTDGSFYALGAALGQAAAVPANSGAGAAYMTVVTGQGSTVSIVGRIAGETGTAGTALTLDVGSFSSRAVELTPFAYTATAPEPTTLTALGAIAFAGARRSRRAVRA
jgi:hypothetical protein